MAYIERSYHTEQFEMLFHDDNIMNPVVKVLDALEIIDTAPTADVVPKSEVARDFDDLKRYIILNENIAIKCKRENGEQNEEYWKGKISAFKQIRAYIDAELKKKYTESEDKP